MKNKISKLLTSMVFLPGLIFSVSGNAQAALINNTLVGPGYSGTSPTTPATYGTSTTINGGIFTVANNNQGAGSGYGAFNPFLRTQHKGIESGFNTNANNILDNVGSGHTHAVLLSELRTITYLGDQYVRFFLDIGEPDDNVKPLLSTLELELWVNNISNDSDYSNGLGTKVWDLDAGINGDTTLNLDYNILKGGNGKYDIVALFDASLFAAYSPNNYFYLYNKFGKETSSPQEYASEGTFEEWAYGKTGQHILFGCNDPAYAAGHQNQCVSRPIPEPAATWLIGAGLLGLADFYRRKSKSALKA